MKYFNRFVQAAFLAGCMTFSSPLLAESYFRDHHCDMGDISRYDNDLNEKDWDDLYDYLNTKRTMNLAEKSHNLTISGDVRVDWRLTSEKGLRNGTYQKLRGKRVESYDGYLRGHNDFDAQFNLYFDYVCDRAWAVAQICYDNSMGTLFNDQDQFANPQEAADCRDPTGYHGSGFGCDLELKKAYMGYNICCCNNTRFDVELGRRHFYHVFDSEIQFLSRFDGLLLRWNSDFCCFFDYYVYLGGFVIDERVDHFGYITEIGFLDICDTGFDFKYSLIDWRRLGRNRCDTSNPDGCKFLNSQFTLVYNFYPEIIQMPAKFYGAFVWNHDPSRQFRDVADEQNIGWYAGFRCGNVCREGDWAFDIQYQYVEAESVPDFDMSGIGRGNVLDETLTLNQRGNTNFKGWRVEALYALTDNITFDARFQESRQIEKDIGGKHHYSQFELEAIYAF